MYISETFKGKMSQYPQIIYNQRALKAFYKILQSFTNFLSLSTTLHLAK